MFEGVLKRLLSDDLLVIAGTISGATALRQFLASRNEVQKVADALKNGSVTDDSLRRFTDELLKDLRHGELFRHDLVLAAIAVVFERWFTPFADEYLHGLAGLEASEMPYGPRVAREVLASRKTGPAKITSNVTWYGGGEATSSPAVAVYQDFSKGFQTQAKNQFKRPALSGDA
jgi:hypothetical protein